MWQSQLRLCVLLIMFATPAIIRADWPAFRGANGLGISSESGLPTNWNDTENVLWKREVPGAGGSSPITHGDRIFVTYYSGYGLDERSPGKPGDLQRHLLCLNRSDGEPVWDKAISARAEIPFRGFQARHGYASSTPATDGQRVYVFFEKEGVFAFDFDGNQVWQANVGQQTHGWGSATSPVLYNDLVIVNASVESGALVALNKASGDEVWRKEGMSSTWGTPLLVDTEGGKHELVVSVEGAIVAFDPQTGSELWTCAGIQDYICPSVVAQNGIVFAIGGRRGMCLAVQTGGRGKVEPLWTQRAGSNVSSPVVAGDYLYWVSDRGIAYCLNANDGEIVYQERLPGGGLEVYASAVMADGKIYAVTRDDGTFVLAEGPQFKLLAQNKFESDSSTANGSPAVDRGQLLLRTNQFLYCIGQQH